MFVSVFQRLQLLQVYVNMNLWLMLINPFDYIYAIELIYHSENFWEIFNYYDMMMAIIVYTYMYIPYCMTYLVIEHLFVYIQLCLCLTSNVLHLTDYTFLCSNF